MPQFEAALLAALARARRRPVVLTYQCDLRLPAGGFNRAVEWSLRPLNRLAAAGADAIVVSSDDYARHSPFLARTMSTSCTPSRRWSICRRAPDAATRRAARIAGDLRAPDASASPRASPRRRESSTCSRRCRAIVAAVPDARVVFTGAYKDTVGEEAYWQRLAPLLERHRERLRVPRPAADRETCRASSPLCDVLAVTSLNSTEAFGLVQVEAMLSGTPVVATDLPGVREAGAAAPAWA